jgi:hypothetical protein
MDLFEHVLFSPSGIIALIRMSIMSLAKSAVIFPAIRRDIYCISDLLQSIMGRNNSFERVEGR